MATIEMALWRFGLKLKAFWNASRLEDCIGMVSGSASGN